MLVFGAAAGRMLTSGGVGDRAGEEGFTGGGVGVGAFREGRCFISDSGDAGDTNQAFGTGVASSTAVAVPAGAAAAAAD